MLAIKNSVFLSLVLSLVFLVSADVDSKSGINSLTSTSGDAAAEALNELGFLKPGIEKIMGLPELNEGEDLLREKCLKNGNNESFDLAMAARAQFEECVSGLVDVKKLKQEIDAAKPTGDLDTVFKKYCGKTPIVKNCTQELLKGTESCFGENERSQITVLQNVSDSLMSFICHKEGDRIALFIAEGGPECLTSQVNPVQLCINKTLETARASGKGNISEDMREFAFDSENCGYFTQTQQCVVQALGRCSEPTPANVVGSLFDFVRKSTPCVKFINNAGSSSFVFSALSFIIPIGAIILSKI